MKKDSLISYSSKVIAILKVISSFKANIALQVSSWRYPKNLLAVAMSVSICGLAAAPSVVAAPTDANVAITITTTTALAATATAETTITTKAPPKATESTTPELVNSSVVPLKDGVLTLTLPAVTIPKIATVDWTVAETLLALGVNPVAVGDRQSYQVWVEYPMLNQQDTLDLGTRLQPNLVQLLQSKAELTILSPMYAGLESTLSKYTKTATVNFTASENFWQVVQQGTKEVACLAQLCARGEQLLAAVEQEVGLLKEQVAPYKQRPLAVVQFADSRHFRLYTGNSIVGAMIEQLGLVNAAPAVGNLWGFENHSLEYLVNLPYNTQLIVLQPYPQHVPQSLAHNTLWQALPLSHDVKVLPPVWTFGGVSAAVRFAQLLTGALVNKDLQNRAQGEKSW